MQGTPRYQHGPIYKECPSRWQVHKDGQALESPSQENHVGSSEAPESN
jgi:hypothetical protein